jgi:hypothetical protein
MKFISAEVYKNGYGSPYITSLVVELDGAEVRRLLSSASIDRATSGRFKLGEEIEVSSLFGDHDKFKKHSHALDRIINALDDARSLIHPPAPKEAE